MEQELQRRDDMVQDEPDPEEEIEEENDESAAHMRGTFDENLSLNIDDTSLQKIANELIQGIEDDLKSRTEWEAIAEKAIEYLGLKIEPASTEITPEGSVSKVFHTLLLEAAIYFWANSHAELLPASGPCKVANESVQQPTDPNPAPVPAQGMPPQAAPAAPQMNDDEIAQARDGRAADARNDAALRFAQRVAAERGRLLDADIAALRAAGFSDAETVEIVLHVALNVLTNYVNNVAHTDVDFPRVSAHTHA